MRHRCRAGCGYHLFGKNSQGTSLILQLDILIKIVILVINLGCYAKCISVAEAKAWFSECIRQVESGSLVLITRQGKPVAAIVRAADLERLERLRKAGPESGRAGIAGGWENSEELAAILDGSPRHGHSVIADLGH